MMNFSRVTARNLGSASPQQTGYPRHRTLFLSVACCNAAPVDGMNGERERPGAVPGAAGTSYGAVLAQLQQIFRAGDLPPKGTGAPAKRASTPFVEILSAPVSSVMVAPIAKCPTRLTLIDTPENRLSEQFPRFCLSNLCIAGAAARPDHLKPHRAHLQHAVVDASVLHGGRLFQLIQGHVGGDDQR